MSKFEQERGPGSQNAPHVQDSNRDRRYHPTIPVSFPQTRYAATTVSVRICGILSALSIIFSTGYWKEQELRDTLLNIFLSSTADKGLPHQLFFAIETKNQPEKRHGFVSGLELQSLHITEDAESTASTQAPMFYYLAATHQRWVCQHQQTYEGGRQEVNSTSSSSKHSGIPQENAPFEAQFYLPQPKHLSSTFLILAVPIIFHMKYSTVWKQKTPKPLPALGNKFIAWYMQFWRKHLGVIMPNVFHDEIAVISSQTLGMAMHLASAMNNAGGQTRSGFQCSHAASSQLLSILLS
ncbi:hypothetical protein L218DRAFT_950669 [Marasmius fiardii PR-910]|nr:hypothetical protein L218DRAFT_950669 [Marasmius fiardii PR-910]